LDPDDEPASLDDFDEESPGFELDLESPDFESLDPLSPELDPDSDPADFLSLDFESEPERSFDSEEEEWVAPLRLSVL
jgi:hypothetical protein